MKSLLRYPGGKTRAINILKEYLPSDCKEICSPFIGGGSFECYLDDNGIKVHAYDNFKPLVEYWKALYYLPIELYNEVVRYVGITKESFYQLQKDVLNLVGIKQAAAFYVLNRCSFSGSTLSGGISPNTPRFTQSGIDKILDSDISFVVKHLSFEQSILLHDCLIFADPPYYITQTLYGNKGDMHKDFNHVLLADILIKRGNFIVTYNDCNEVRELYKGCKFDIVEWAYGMNKSKKSNEVIISSPPLNKM